ncbi:selenide, water dikinase SelD [bacterium]|nr:selenide, water dikinase SelD [bacterium]
MLSKLPPIVDPRAMVSSGTVDDAGVYRLNDDTALVVTLDFFTPIVDDARDYGRIAAANSLSDVYAMGGTPLVALNIVCFPDGELPMPVMTEILLGSNEKVTEAGALVLGGHSVSDRELKFGLAVVGTVNPGRIVSNANARVGDVLALTKPVGVGVLATALKEGELPPEGVVIITELMATLNWAASEAMLSAGATAATDVTGFGLIGHASELADASGVTLEIAVLDVPLVEGAKQAIERGLAPGGLFSNQHYYSAFVESRTRADGRTVELMYDPQTSGGLLVALPKGSYDAFDRALSARGGSSRVIGRVVDRGDRAVVLT